MDYFKTGRTIAVVFFLLATVVFALFYGTRLPLFVSAARALLTTAVIVYWFYFAVVLFNLLVGKISTRITLRTMGIMLLNVPVGMGYAYGFRFLLGG